MRDRLRSHPSPHFSALFDAAEAKVYDAEAEITLAVGDGALTISIPAIGGVLDSAAFGVARSVLSQVAELDAQASSHLMELPEWAYGGDLVLWLLIVQDDNVRFCYQQTGVNDEQVVGFTLDDGIWVLRGSDPRFRGEGPNPFPVGE